MVQLAKSAICAGLRTLLRVEELCGTDAAELAVAGGFGQLSGCKQRGPHRPSARRTRSPCARAGKRGLERRGHAFAEQGLYPPQRGPGCRSEDGGPFHQRGIHERLYRRYVFLTLPKGLAKNVPVLYTVAYTIAYCSRAFPGKRVKLPRGPAHRIGFPSAGVPGTALFSQFTMDGSCASVLSKKPRSRSGRRGFLFLLSGGIETCLHKRKKR